LIDGVQLMTTYIIITTQNHNQKFTKYFLYPTTEYY